MDTLNLDSMSIGELWELHDSIKAHPRIQAKKYGLTVADAKHYKNYAVNKAVAMACRIEGKIEEAREYESICDRIYQRMTVKQW